MISCLLQLKLKSYKWLPLFIWIFQAQSLQSQDISLYNQFNGKVDFTMIGNTLNLMENGGATTCTINTSSSANLSLNPNDTIEAAYLYWAGSGVGDLEIKLNNQVINAERTFSDFFNSHNYFSAFADVTTQVKNTGNGVYTISELDLTNIISDYCSFGGNFGGWAIVIIYKNNTLPINQINIYDGMQSVPDNITIQLDDLEVIDTARAKIGFLAWEGDSALAVNESLRINGVLIGNPPLNPDTNAFNGTNSFTGETDLYNMDMDYYNIADYIQVGDTSATIELTSGQDYVMVNCVVTKLNTLQPNVIEIPIIPQIFSPNADENNTLFSITNLREYFTAFELQIYNRYGTIIYNGNINTKDWDGTYKGKKLPAGTYFYILKLNDAYYGSMRGWVYLTY